MRDHVWCCCPWMRTAQAQREEEHEEQQRNEIADRWMVIAFPMIQEKAIGEEEPRNDCAQPDREANEPPLAEPGPVSQLRKKGFRDDDGTQDAQGYMNGREGQREGPVHLEEAQPISRRGPGGIKPALKAHALFQHAIRSAQQCQVTPAQPATSYQLARQNGTRAVESSGQDDTDRIVPPQWRCRASQHLGDERGEQVKCEHSGPRQLATSKRLSRAGHLRRGIW